MWSGHSVTGRGVSLRFRFRLNRSLTASFRFRSGRSVTGRDISGRLGRRFTVPFPVGSIGLDIVRAFGPRPPGSVRSLPPRRLDRLDIPVGLLRSQSFQHLLGGEKVPDVLVVLDLFGATDGACRPLPGMPDERHLQLEKAVGGASPGLVVLGSKIEAARLQRLGEALEPRVLEDAKKDLPVLLLILASQGPGFLDRHLDFLGSRRPRGAAGAILGDPEQEFSGLFLLGLFGFLVVVDVRRVPRDEGLKVGDAGLEFAGDDVPRQSERDHFEDLLGEHRVVGRRLEHGRCSGTEWTSAAVLAIWQFVY